jgi:hypothetical protein
MLKILIAAALVAVSLTVVKDERVLRRAGLLSTCEHVPTPAQSWGEWWACKSGRLSGNADLSSRSCVRVGVAVGREYWRCPESLAQSRAARF